MTMPNVFSGKSQAGGCVSVRKFAEIALIVGNPADPARFAPVFARPNADSRLP